MNIDARTIGILLIFFTPMQALFMVIYARTVRRYPGVTYWAFSNVLIATGTALVVLRDFVPLFFSAVASNTLIIAGACLLYYGSGLFEERPVKPWLVAAPTVLVFVLLVYFTYVDNVTTYRAASTSVLAAPVLFINAYVLLSQPGRWRARAYWLATGTFIVYGAFHAVRIPLVLFFEPVRDVLGSTPLQIVTLFFLLFSIAAWTMGLIVIISHRMTTELNEKNREISVALHTADGLLLNILPPLIAARMKLGERELSDHFPQAMVLFADIVNFTVTSQRITPAQVVSGLNQIFTEFDQLAQKYGLEKIKTIGDCYMAVSGLPVPSARYMQNAADMALEIQTLAAQLSLDGRTPLQLRIGLNHGEVVAGVIGATKFAYDLWGDTVNTASRMESYGEPGRIQCTEAVYTALRGEYEFQARGEVQVKGKGAVQSYFLVGKQAA